MLPLLVALMVVSPDSRPALPTRLPGASIVVFKSKRELRLVANGSVVRTYHVGLGLEPVRPKKRQGDYATPEGKYYICRKNPQSKYDYSLALSYPGPTDAERGLDAGLITPRQRDQILSAWNSRATPPWNTPLGGEIMIHGKGSSSDWTWGCIALDYQDIEELYRVVPLGAPVEIRP